MNATRYLSATVAILLLAGCQAQNARPTEAGVNPAEVSFTTNAYQIIEFDRQEGALAETQAKTPRVKALAQQLTMQANGFAAELEPTAKAASIQPPRVLRNDLRIRLGHMRLQQGLDFDRAYINDQIASHEEAIRMQDAMSGMGVSPQFAELIKKGQDLLRKNLETLLDVQMQMGPSRSRTF